MFICLFISQYVLILKPYSQTGSGGKERNVHMRTSLCYFLSKSSRHNGYKDESIQHYTCLCFAHTINTYLQTWQCSHKSSAHITDTINRLYSE